MSKKRRRAPAPPPPSPAPQHPRYPAPLLLIICIIALAFAGLLIYRQAGSGYSAGAYKNYNVLLVTLDTLRADHLPMYGYKKVKTPALDQLAAQSFVFDDAISHAPMTLPSHTCILTGLLPIGNGVRDNGGFLVDPKVTTLAEILKQRGYATSAFVSSFVLDSRWQLNQGFDFYFDNFGISEFEGLNPRDIQRRAGDTELEAEQWLDKNASKPFFSWVHFYDPHDPYDPPDPYKTTYEGRPYDGEIAYTDEIVGRLLAKLQQLKVDERTIVIVTADHGEGLGEHNEMMHAMFVYNTTQHVPLLIHLPNSKGKRISGVVRHIDLAPSILDWLDIPIPSGMQGKSLIPLMHGKEKADREGFSESVYAELHYGWSPLQSITTEQYRYIHAPRAELYDRQKDPHETSNLIQEKPYIAKALQEKLDAIVQKYSNNTLNARQQIDPETSEKLQALGYIGNTVESTEQSRRIDPKDKIHLAQAMQMTMTAISEKQYEHALELLEPVLQEEPNMTDAHLFASVAYGNLKDYDKSIDELYRTLSLRPDYTTAFYNLGWVYEMKGDYGESEKWFNKVLQHEKQHLMATIQLARIYHHTNQQQKAEPYIRKAVEWYSNAISETKGEDGRSELYSTLGELYFSLGELQKALDNLTTAIEITPEKPMLHFNLAQVYEAKQDMIGAANEYEQETKVSPNNYKAYMNLGIIYTDMNNPSRAAACFQKVLQIQPNDPPALYLLAKTYFVSGQNLEQARRLAEASVQADAKFKKGYLLLASIYKELGRNRDAYETLKKAM